MYKKFILFVAFALSALSCFAQEPPVQRSAANVAFRDSIANFLKLEGYVPSIDEDGDIEFKKEGSTYFVTVVDDEAPFYVQFTYYLGMDDDIDQVAMLKAMNETNRDNRCIKCSIVDKDLLWITIESYDTTVAEFGKTYDLYLEHLSEGGVILAQAYDKYSKEKTNQSK